ncbi:MAG TPA: Uma2 family endonuclease [Fimbriimonas sp.]|nr:Uma2 family endonuclease [Fimbriimonas sp.]
MALPQKSWTSPLEYLKAERHATTKHELLDGEVYAMSGVSRHHWRIVANLSTTLNNRLGGRDCDAGASDLRVRIPATEAYLYPDIVAYCGEPKFLDDHHDTLENPILLAEVLSPSTHRFDQRVKLQHYMKIESLHTYLIVAQDEVHVQQLERHGEDWHISVYTSLDDSVKLPSLEIELPLREVYYRVRFESQNESDQR